MNIVSGLFIFLGFLGVACSLILLRGNNGNPKTKKIALICGAFFLTLTVIGFCVDDAPFFSSSSDKTSSTCPVCHTTYSYDKNNPGMYEYSRENIKSIAKTKMCKKCYSNFKNASEAVDKYQYDH